MVQVVVAQRVLTEQLYQLMAKQAVQAEPVERVVLAGVLTAVLMATVVTVVQRVPVALAAMVAMD